MNHKADNQVTQGYPGASAADTGSALVKGHVPPFLQARAQILRRAGAIKASLLLLRSYRACQLQEPFHLWDQQAQ